jgi:hypothetical protein
MKNSGKEMAASETMLAARSIHFPFVDGRDDAEADRQRHGDERRIAGQEHGVVELGRDRGDDVALVGQGHAQIAPQRVEEPLEVADIGRPVETEFMPEDGQRLGRGTLPQDGTGDVARQDLGRDEDEDADGQQRQKPEGDPT